MAALLEEAKFPTVRTGHQTLDTGQGRRTHRLPRRYDSRQSDRTRMDNGRVHPNAPTNDGVIQSHSGCPVGDPAPPASHSEDHGPRKPESATQTHRGQHSRGQHRIQRVLRDLAAEPLDLLRRTGPPDNTVPGKPANSIFVSSRTHPRCTEHKRWIPSTPPPGPGPPVSQLLGRHRLHAAPDHRPGGAHRTHGSDVLQPGTYSRVPRTTHWEAPGYIVTDKQTKTGRWGGYRKFNPETRRWNWVDPETGKEERHSWKQHVPDFPTYRTGITTEAAFKNPNVGFPLPGHVMTTSATGPGTDIWREYKMEGWEEYDSSLGEP